jgi:DnaJ domain
MLRMAQDPYSVLGVTRTASPIEIKAAFHRLAKENHPDLHQADPGAEARFKAASAAYEQLSDPELRASLDGFDIDRECDERNRPFDSHQSHAQQDTARSQPDLGRVDSTNADFLGAIPPVGRRANPPAGWLNGPIGLAIVVFLMAAKANSVIYYATHDHFRYYVRLQHPTRWEDVQVGLAVALPVALIKLAADYFSRLRLSGTTLMCLGIAVLLAICSATTILDRALNDHFESTALPPYFIAFIRFVCLLIAVLLCVPPTRRAAVATIASIDLAGGILAEMYGQTSVALITVVTLPMCIGLLWELSRSDSGG